jgi:hypothetical protein
MSLRRAVGRVEGSGKTHVNIGSEEKARSIVMAAVSIEAR